MDRAIEILVEEIDKLEAEKSEIVFNYRYDYMTTDQKMALQSNIIREIKGLKDAISVLEAS